MELFLITIILNSQQNHKDRRHEKSLVDIFLGLKKYPDLMTGIEYFLKKVVSRTNVTSSKQDRSTLRWGCKVINHGLHDLASILEKN